MPFNNEDREALRRAWDEYIKHGSEEARVKIIVSYTPLVNKIARDILKKKPSNFDFEDLVQAGMIGLINAVSRFDPEREVLFSTFASLRVRGAMYDEINGMDWTPRLVRERIKLVINATEAHYKDNQHAPSDQEISEIIANKFGKNVPADQVALARSQANKTHIHAIDHTATSENEHPTAAGIPALSRQSDPIMDTVNVKMVDKIIRDGITDICTEIEARVLYGVFYEEKTMKEIAKELNVTVSKVSAAKRSATQKLKHHFREAGIRVVDFY